MGFSPPLSPSEASGDPAASGAVAEPSAPASGHAPTDARRSPRSVPHTASPASLAQARAPWTQPKENSVANVFPSSVETESCRGSPVHA